MSGVRYKEMEIIVGTRNTRGIMEGGAETCECDRDVRSAVRPGQGNTGGTGRNIIKGPSRSTRTRLVFKFLFSFYFVQSLCQVFLSSPLIRMSFLFSCLFLLSTFSFPLSLSYLSVFSPFYCCTYTFSSFPTFFPPSTINHLVLTLRNSLFFHFFPIFMSYFYFFSSFSCIFTFSVLPNFVLLS